MKKTLYLFFILSFLSACSSKEIDTSYKFKDLTISYPSDIDMVGKVTNTYGATLASDDYFISIDKIINDNNLDFKKIKEELKNIAVFNNNIKTLVNDDKYAIYEYGENGLVGVYLDEANDYYVLIAQGEKDILKANYDWTLKAFKNVKVN